LFGRELYENGGIINYRQSEELTQNKVVLGTYQSRKPERCRRIGRLPHDRAAQWPQLRRPEWWSRLVPPCCRPLWPAPAKQHKPPALGYTLKPDFLEKLATTSTALQL